MLFLTVLCDIRSEHHLLLPMVQPRDAADVVLATPVGCVECICRGALGVTLPLLLLRLTLLIGCAAGRPADVVSSSNR